MISFENKINSNTILLIGKNDNNYKQTRDKLKQYLSVENLTQLEKKTKNISSKNRQTEKLFTHLLLNIAISKIGIQRKEGVLIEYSDNGSPVLPHIFISISHTHRDVAVLVSTDFQTGIDIEYPRVQTEKVKHKFLCEKEISNLDKYSGNERIEYLTIYWCAKETLFKFYRKGNVDFSKNLFIEKFENTENQSITGQINLPDYKKKIAINLLHLKNEEENKKLIVTYCLEK